MLLIVFVNNRIEIILMGKAIVEITEALLKSIFILNVEQD